MLDEGIIRSSTNMFSTPVLLVAKRDGTCRFYVDYRALNNVTIKDIFPISTIHELFNELDGYSYFPRLSYV